MNRINALFGERKQNILSIYFTAGFPTLNSTMEIMKTLEETGVDMIELGMPFSDPLADGPVIQHSSEVALRNGMNLDILFEQTKQMREHIRVPVLLMGYFNQVLQYGPERFLQRAAINGFDGLIIPDLPVHEYQTHYQLLFEKYGLRIIFLVTPQTSEERVRKIDDISHAFIYLVSSASTTGAKQKFSADQEEYFRRIQSYALKNPLVAGFGIANKEMFTQACSHTNGAIVGSAFIRALDASGDTRNNIKTFVQSIKELQTQTT